MVSTIHSTAQKAPHMRHIDGVTVESKRSTTVVHPLRASAKHKMKAFPLPIFQNYLAVL